MATKRRTKAEIERGRTVAAAIVTKIFEGIERGAEDWRRNHLGASLLGHGCDRYLWQSFRWAVDPQHDGKQLRLFGRGHREEPELISNLQAAGLKVSGLCPETQKQWRFQLGHLGGSADAIIYGVPDFPPSTPFLGEFKTQNLKGFTYLKAKGVRSAKREHFIQTQVYMDRLGLEWALYVVVCKDNDDIYVELIQYDKAIAEKALARGQAIVDMEEPPARKDKEQAPCVYVSKDGTRWPCDHFDLCHGQAMPERSCRTCAESTPMIAESGKPAFLCTVMDEVMDPMTQRVGCRSQISIPTIVNAQVSGFFEDEMDRTMVYQFEDGTEKREEPRDAVPT